MVSVDAGVIPIGSATLLPTGPLPVRGSDLFSFGISVQGRIPVNRWEPYILLEPSLLVNSYSIGERTGTGSVDWRGSRHSKFGLQGGAGTRYYIKSKWGVRAEYRYISCPRNFNEISVGIFYQFEGYSGFTFRRGWNRMNHVRNSD
jgi:opacity protein-like surface antigen